MRTIRIFLPLAAAVMGLILPTAASADPYPADTPDLGVSSETVTVGSTDVLVGSGFGANDTIRITIQYDEFLARAQTVRADASGDFRTTILLTEAGIAIVTAIGDPSGVSASVVVHDLQPGSALPVTGQSGTALWLALIGSAVLATGVVVLVLVRSRRRRPAHRAT